MQAVQEIRCTLGTAFTSSATTNTRLQGADFSVRKSFSLITSTRIVSGPSVVKGHYC